MSEIPQCQDDKTAEAAKIHKIISYGSIVLNFGKYKGKSLNVLVREKPDYLRWLLNSLEQDKKEKTPTMRAIMSFIKYKLEDSE